MIGTRGKGRWQTSQLVDHNAFKNETNRQTVQPSYPFSRLQQRHNRSLDVTLPPSIRHTRVVRGQQSAGRDRHNQPCHDDVRISKIHCHILCGAPLRPFGTCRPPGSTGLDTCWDRTSVTRHPRRKRRSGWALAVQWQSPRGQTVEQRNAPPAVPARTPAE